jgi:hypothetical protein
MEHLRYGNSPSSSNKVYVTTTTTNHYFYSNNKLDSIHSVGGLNSYVTDSNRKTIIFNYGADGEIVSKIEKTPISTLLLGNTAYEVRETEYEYDNHPNPFYLLYRQNGLFLKQLEDFNFSIHNPIKQTTTITTDTGITKSSVNIYYEYNELGLPTKIQHGSSPIATTIEYQR